MPNTSIVPSKYPFGISKNLLSCNIYVNFLSGIFNLTIKRASESQEIRTRPAIIWINRIWEGMDSAKLDPSVGRGE